MYGLLNSEIHIPFMTWESEAPWDGMAAEVPGKLEYLGETVGTIGGW